MELNNEFITFLEENGFYEAVSEEKAPEFEPLKYIGRSEVPIAILRDELDEFGVITPAPSRYEQLIDMGVLEEESGDVPLRLIKSVLNGRFDYFGNGDKPESLILNEFGRNASFRMQIRSPVFDEDARFALEDLGEFEFGFCQNGYETSLENAIPSISDLNSPLYSYGIIPNRIKHGVLSKYDFRKSRTLKERISDIFSDDGEKLACITFGQELSKVFGLSRLGKAYQANLEGELLDGSKVDFYASKRINLKGIRFDCLVVFIPDHIIRLRRPNENKAHKVSQFWLLFADNKANRDKLDSILNKTDELVWIRPESCLNGRQYELGSFMKTSDLSKKKQPNDLKGGIFLPKTPTGDWEGLPPEENKKLVAKMAADLYAADKALMANPKTLREARKEFRNASMNFWGKYYDLFPEVREDELEELQKRYERAAMAAQSHYFKGNKEKALKMAKVAQTLQERANTLNKKMDSRKTYSPLKIEAEIEFYLSQARDEYLAKFPVFPEDKEDNLSQYEAKDSYEELENFHYSNYFYALRETIKSVDGVRMGQLASDEGEWLQEWSYVDDEEELFKTLQHHWVYGLDEGSGWANIRILVDLLSINKPNGSGNRVRDFFPVKTEVKEVEEKNKDWERDFMEDEDSPSSSTVKSWQKENNYFLRHGKVLKNKEIEDCKQRLLKAGFVEAGDKLVWKDEKGKVKQVVKLVKPSDRQREQGEGVKEKYTPIEERTKDWKETKPSSSSNWNKNSMLPNPNKKYDSINPQMEDYIAIKKANKEALKRMGLSEEEIEFIYSSSSSSSSSSSYSSSYERPEVPTQYFWETKGIGMKYSRLPGEVKYTKEEREEVLEYIKNLGESLRRK